MDNTRPNPHLDRTLIPLAVKPHQSVCSLHLISKIDSHFLLAGIKLFPSPDHPIHPPQMEGDPWDCEVLPDCGYTFKIKKVRFRFCLHVNISARVSSIFMPTRKMKNRTSRFLLRWFFLLLRYRWQIKIAGAWLDHFCGGHATPLCNDCWWPSQELLLQKALLSEVQVGKES